MPTEPTPRDELLHRGLLLEYATLGWNVVGVIVLAITAITAGSVALAAFGLDSLIEILASTMVETARERAEEQRAEKLAKIDEQVQDGSLIIRQMTDEERERYPPPPPQSTVTGRTRLRPRW